MLWWLYQDVGIFQFQSQQCIDLNGVIDAFYIHYQQDLEPMAMEVVLVLTNIVLPLWHNQHILPYIYRLLHFKKKMCLCLDVLMFVKKLPISFRMNKKDEHAKREVANIAKEI